MAPTRAMGFLAPRTPANAPNARVGGAPHKVPQRIEVDSTHVAPSSTTSPLPTHPPTTGAPQIHEPTTGTTPRAEKTARCGSSGAPHCPLAALSRSDKTCKYKRFPLRCYFASTARGTTPTTTGNALPLGRWAACTPRASPHQERSDCGSVLSHQRRFPDP